jgi:hypothetical protein
VVFEGKTAVQAESEPANRREHPHDVRAAVGTIEEAVQVGGHGSFVGSKVDKFGFGQIEGEPELGQNTQDGLDCKLESFSVLGKWVREHEDWKVVDVRLGGDVMQMVQGMKDWQGVDGAQHRGERGALWDADGAEGDRGARMVVDVKCDPALRKVRLEPGADTIWKAKCSESVQKALVVDVVKVSRNVQGKEQWVFPVLPGRLNVVDKG